MGGSKREAGWWARDSENAKQNVSNLFPSTIALAIEKFLDERKPQPQTGP